MRRRTMWKRLVARLVVFVSALLVVELSLDSVSAEPPVGAKRTKQRQAVEAILDQDVDWDVGDAKTVTLEQFIAHVRAKHGLAIRWDVATFRTTFSDSSKSSGLDALTKLSGAAPRESYYEPVESLDDQPKAGTTTFNPYAPSASASLDDSTRGAVPSPYRSSTPYPVGSTYTSPAPKADSATNVHLSGYPATDSTSPYQQSLRDTTGAYNAFSTKPDRLIREELLHDIKMLEMRLKQHQAILEITGPATAATDREPVSPTVPPSDSDKSGCDAPAQEEGASPEPQSETDSNAASKAESPSEDKASSETQPPPGGKPEDAAGAPSAEAPDQPEPAPENLKKPDAGPDAYLVYAQAPVSLATLGLEDATIGETLEQLLAAASPPMLTTDELGIPLGTRAMELAYLIDGRSVVITTRMQAHFRKETRVYPVASLKSITPQELARVVTHSVRPWSWRVQSADVSHKLTSRLPTSGKIKLPKLNMDFNQALQLVSDGALAESPAAPSATSEEYTPEQLAMIADFWSAAMTGVWEMGLAAIEMIYHAEPPTGDIQVLNGMLIINQSQGAHREIEDLIEQLTIASKANEAK